MLGILNFTNQISDIENLAKAGSITSAEKTEMIENVINSIDPSITTKLRFWMAVIPVVLLIAAFFIFRTRFIIDEKYYDQMIKEIAERKNAEAK
jgi:Na+/melibiose symporter-like transporter